MSSKILVFAVYVIAVFCFALLPVGCSEEVAVQAKDDFIATDVFPTASQSVLVDAEAVDAIWSGSQMPVITKHADASGALLGYSVEMTVVSRSGPFPILAVFGADGCVKSAKVLSYRASRGRQVTSYSFTSQFEGKCSDSPLVVGKDIQSVTRATLSCKAMTQGVRKARSAIAKLKT